MADTVETVIKSLLASMDSEDHQLLAVQWLNDRYRELASRVRFNYLKRYGELRTVAAVSSGAVAVTKGSKTVTGTGTTWATSPGAFATTTQPYWAFRVDNVWHEVDVVTNDTSLTLVTAYTGDTNASASYYLVKRYYPLASSARWLGDFAHPRLSSMLGVPINQSELDSYDVQRIPLTSYPTCVSFVGATTTGNTDGEGLLMIELYPYVLDTELIRYTYWTVPTLLTLTGSLPAQIDGYILKEGAYIEYCRFMMAQREKEGKLEATAFWRNEMNAAKTKWEYLINQATRADRAVDDTVALLQRDSGASHGFGDIVTARGHWLSKYTRP